MNVNFSNTEFYKELESFLPKSNAEKRKMWATTIIEEDIDIKYLSELLKCEQRIAIRFQWLLSEIGGLNPNKLFIELPYLLDQFKSLTPIHQTHLATLWHIVGVPTENEAIAINLLFQWIISPDTNVTIKSRSLLVLVTLTKKYPELKNELIFCLENQMDKHTNDFKKRTNKLLIKLKQ